MRSLPKEIHIAAVVSTLHSFGHLYWLTRDPVDSICLTAVASAILLVAGWFNLVIYIGYLGVRFDPALNNEARPLPITAWDTLPAIWLIVLPPVPERPSLDRDHPVRFCTSQLILSPAPLRGPPIPVR